MPQISHFTGLKLITSNIKSLEEKIADAIVSCLPAAEKPVALHEPLFRGNEWNFVKDCLDTGWVSSVGSYVDKFESELAKFTQTKYCVAVSNGTAALHMALKLVGVEKDDEVLMPTLTFVATANAVSYLEATPHFVDSEKQTLGVDPVKLKEYLQSITHLKNGNLLNKRTGKRISALIVMHTLGHPVQLEEINEVCKEFNLKLVEDAAESLGSHYKGRHVGSTGHVATLSFNGNKIVTTGGGGAIITNNQELARLAKHLTTTAKTPHKWRFFHDQVGYNYRLPNINSALGCAQLEQMPYFLEKKRELAQRYKQTFANFKDVEFFLEPKDCKSNYWLNALIVKDTSGALLKNILDLTASLNIGTRPLWELMHTLPMYKNCPKMDLSTAELLQKTVLTIPSSASL